MPESGPPRSAAGRSLPGVLRLAGFTGAFVAAGLLGRMTIIDGEALSLVWPAAGIATLWIASGKGRARWVDLAVLALAAFTVNSLTGAPPLLALTFVTTNVLQVILLVVMVRTWIPGLWGFGGDEELRRLRDLGILAGAATLSCLIGAALGAVGLFAVLGTTDLSNFLVWWGRNAVAVIVIVTFGLLISRPLLKAGSVRGALDTCRAALTPTRPLRAVEAALLVIASAGLYVVLFLNADAAPLAFLVLVMSVWAGIRFAPLAVATHGIAMGAAGIIFTLAGVGPFAAIESLHYRALTAQVFVAMAVLKGLALSFSRRERDDAVVELAAARRSADDRARLLDAVLESMKEAITVVDDQGRILVRNAAASDLAALVGPPTDRIQPAASYGIFHADGRPLGDDELPAARALAGEVVGPVDLHLRLPDGVNGRVLESTARLLNSEDPDAPRRALINTRDVTLDRQHRDTLASFAGVVAHDLLNPLSVVNGWSETLAAEFARGPVSPAVGRMMVTRIQDSATHMREFVADLLSYTVARDQSLRPEAVDLSTLVRSLAGLRADGPSAPLVAASDGLHVWADPGLTRQLLDNLIGNAVKYVAPGVRPVVEVTGVAVDGWLEVRVSDNGIGIPEDQRESVFETFHQAHSAEYGGTGLGLAICRRIVDRHGGTIAVTAGARGTGTTVVFQLPLAASTPSTTPSTTPRPATSASAAAS